MRIDGDGGTHMTLATAIPSNGEAESPRAFPPHACLCPGRGSPAKVLPAARQSSDLARRGPATGTTKAGLRREASHNVALRCDDDASRAKACWSEQGLTPKFRAPPKFGGWRMDHGEAQ